jgi:hypothetical protein
MYHWKARLKPNNLHGIFLPNLHIFRGKFAYEKYDPIPIVFLAAASALN